MWGGAEGIFRSNFTAQDAPGGTAVRDVTGRHGKRKAG